MDPLDDDLDVGGAGLPNLFVEEDDAVGGDDDEDVESELG